MSFLSICKKIKGKFFSYLSHYQYKNIHKSARVYYTTVVYNPDNLYMEDNTNIDSGGVVMNSRAKLIMKRNSGAAVGLLAITGNHMSVVGKNIKQVTNDVKDDLDLYHEMDRDIVVEEDVWIGSHVTLLAGVTIGRGAELGSGCVVRCNIPPYSVVVGNPAKIVGFRFTPEEIINHEMLQYEEKDRLPMDLLQKNYKKYFLDRMVDIRQFLKL